MTQQNNRDEAAKAIRHALRFRSGKAWSVTVGRGTVWGWITVTAPKSRLVDGYMTDDDRAELARLFDLDAPVHNQGLMIAPEERNEYENRARGLHTRLVLCADDICRAV